VVTIDIKGAFLKANVPEDLELIVRMEGELAELFAELNPDLKLDENGILYLKCLKAVMDILKQQDYFMMNLIVL
jgi:hypothetical protein